MRRDHAHGEQLVVAVEGHLTFSMVVRPNAPRTLEREAECARATLLLAGWLP